MKTKYEIHVVEAGWVFVINTETNVAQCIRQWGTTRGLGQLALTGPTKDTILDPCGVLLVAEGKTLFVLRCDHDFQF